MLSVPARMQLFRMISSKWLGTRFIRLGAGLWVRKLSLALADLEASVLLLPMALISSPPKFKLVLTYSFSLSGVSALIGLFSSASWIVLENMSSYRSMLNMLLVTENWFGAASCYKDNPAMRTLCPGCDVFGLEAMLYLSVNIWSTLAGVLVSIEMTLLSG